VSRQLALGLQLTADTTFDTFIPTGNQEALACLMAAAHGVGEGFLTLWGSAGCGKSHLLQATCLQASQLGRQSLYLPLADHQPLSPELLHDLEQMDLICLDDLQQIIGNPEWEQALYHFFNLTRDSRATLIASTDQPPQTLPLQLADLKSRLNWGPAFHLQPLADLDKTAALQEAARQRGMELTNAAARYLLRHHSREMHRLMALIQRLDEESLRQQRRLTLHFIREQLAGLE
jgi:DnaA family protein